ncbi:MAG: hypothetical protein OXB88_05385 [Bacteriovoracales bacterium]|nr:hypothetical protein [Bacteriovoracales bacterium]
MRMDFSAWKKGHLESLKGEGMGRVVFCQGRCVHRRGDYKTSLTPHSWLRKGEEIETGADSLAQIFFLDGTLLKIYPETLLDLRELSFWEEGPLLVLTLKRGHLFFSPPSKRKTRPTRVVLGTEEGMVHGASLSGFVFQEEGGAGFFQLDGELGGAFLGHWSSRDHSQIPVLGTPFQIRRNQTPKSIPPDFFAHSTFLLEKKPILLEDRTGWERLYGKEGKNKKEREKRGRGARIDFLFQMDKLSKRAFHSAHKALKEQGGQGNSDHIEKAKSELKRLPFQYIRKEMELHARSLDEWKEDE